MSRARQACALPAAQQQAHFGRAQRDLRLSCGEGGSWQRLQAPGPQDRRQHQHRFHHCKAWGEWIK